MKERKRRGKEGKGERRERGRRAGEEKRGRKRKEERKRKGTSEKRRRESGRALSSRAATDQVAHFSQMGQY